MCFQELNRDPSPFHNGFPLPVAFLINQTGTRHGWVSLGQHFYNMFCRDCTHAPGKKGPIVRYFLKILNPLLGDSWAYERLCKVLQYKNLSNELNTLPRFYQYCNITPENLALTPVVPQLPFQATCSCPACALRSVSC